MKRALLCCAAIGALALLLIACKSVAESAKTTAATKAKTDGTHSSAVNSSVTASQGGESTPKEGSYETISPERAKSEMDALTAEGKPFVLLDVRRSDEYAASHIEGALLLPNEEIGTERPDALPDLSVPIYIYCRSGRRSLEAAKKLAAMGYTVYDFGGIIDWIYGTV